MKRKEFHGWAISLEHLGYDLAGGNWSRLDPMGGDLPLRTMTFGTRAAARSWLRPWLLEERMRSDGFRYWTGAKVVRVVITVARR